MDDGWGGWEGVFGKRELYCWDMGWDERDTFV